MTALAIIAACAISFCAGAYATLVLAMMGDDVEQLQPGDTAGWDT